MPTRSIFLRPHYPEIPGRAGAALLIEQENGDIDFWADHAPEDSWFAASDQDRERFRSFRHALAGISERHDAPPRVL